jgi:hypothetical protein
MNRNLPHICRKRTLPPNPSPQTIDFAGGPGGTRTPNQAVMSARHKPQSLYNSNIYDLFGASGMAFFGLFLPQTAAHCFEGATL